MPDDLEHFLNRNDQPNGRGFKPPQKAAARSAMKEFQAGGKSLPNRAHLRMCLMGAGVPEKEADHLAAAA